MQIHKDLEVWQKGISFVTDIYQVTNNFPKEELYGLTNQIRRAAVSIPSNIAEGSARQSNKEFIQFLYIALGSLMEVETQLIISKNLFYIPEDIFTTTQLKINELGKMLNGLIKYRKSKL
ncbi:four helix bundle protein [Amniculibacterium sp. G2-70]|uniref:four helix bundle protein n=1 Tax=Amniculibacterium sp. G2-70 TaxID=2767188 RepID=UPI001654BD3E|nr:four helix bundle protein [Amniculibacterium sp. G2-70]